MTTGERKLSRGMELTKKVVDVGALRSPELTLFLSQSPKHFAVITEFATMEMFGGNPQINLRKSLEIVSKFPRQVILLKGNARVSKLRGRPDKLQKRLQDERKTRSFVEYTRMLSGEVAVDHESLACDIVGKGRAAQQWSESMIDKTASIRSGIANLAQRILSDDLKAMRSGRPASPAFTDQTIKDIMGLTALHFRDVVKLDRPPSSEEALYTFPFRYAVSAYALSVKWVADGGFDNANKKTLRNDYIDMTYAAYASFFEGLITNDAKLREMYRITCWILEKVFRIRETYRA